MKMQFKPDKSTPLSLVIANNAAEVIIQRGTVGWAVHWKVKFSFREYAEGEINLEYSELQEAFGLGRNFTYADSLWLIERYGASVAAQGKYIRWEQWLNIPGPGTGNDGSPNVSIEIDDAIKGAVREILRP
jgi:hypothetical protein